MEAINVNIKKILQKVAGSLNTKTPIIALPMAPIPVQTAYAVPIGNSLVAFTNKSMLMVKQIKNPPYQSSEMLPEVSFALPKQVAKPTSNKPAIISKIQFKIILVFRYFDGDRGRDWFLNLIFYRKLLVS